MSIIEFAVLLVIASIIGSIGQSISGYSFNGCFASILVGLIGAYLGRWIMNEFHLPVIFSITVFGRTIPVVWTIIGAAILSFGLGIITKGKQTDK